MGCFFRMELSLSQKEFIRTHGEEDVRALALHFSRDAMPLLLSQIAGRQTARLKIPSWAGQDDILYLPHLSLEQASSELTARYKASLASAAAGTSVEGGNGRFADLTGGMGIDFSFMAPLFREADYVEQNGELCGIAEHNFSVLGLRHATVHCDDAAHFLEKAAPYDLIYLDPSRRDDAGRKVFRIGDCAPDLTELNRLLLEKAGLVMVKYSPMLDISLALKTLGNVREVHVVSVENECRELLFLLSKTVGEAPQYVAVNLKRSGEQDRFLFTMAQEQQAEISFANAPERYLYEPNASILKAGAFKAVAQSYNLQKLHINSHLYTSNERVADFPGRIFEIETFFVPNRQNSKSFIRETKKANIAVRNFPMTVAEIRRRTGLADGGDLYLFATTLSDERKVWIVCRKV